MIAGITSRQGSVDVIYSILIAPREPVPANGVFESVKARRNITPMHTRRVAFTSRSNVWRFHTKITRNHGGTAGAATKECSKLVLLTIYSINHIIVIL
jgi:hypothetical protein